MILQNKPLQGITPATQVINNVPLNTQDMILRVLTGSKYATGTDKITAFRLAQKVAANDTQWDLSPSELTLLKSLFSTFEQSPLTCGQVLIDLYTLSP